MSVEKITERIMDEAKNYENDMMNEARMEVDQIMKTYQSHAEKIRGEILRRGEKDVAAILSCARHDASLIRQNQVLQMKANLIDEVFKNAEERVLDIPEDNLLELFWNILETAAESGSGEIIFNERDREKFGTKFVAAANKKMRELEKNSEIILSDDSADIKNGFILKYGDTEINCSLEKIIGVKRAKLELQISKILFGNKDGTPAKKK